MIQIMQQLQIENQAIMRSLSEQQEQLNQQQEASHQQMRRLEAMIVNPRSKVPEQYFITNTKPKEHKV